MSLVFNFQSLPISDDPLFVQEFIHHGGILFKVYVLGKEVHVITRPSVYLTAATDPLLTPVIHFDSQYVSKTFDRPFSTSIEHKEFLSFQEKHPFPLAPHALRFEKEAALDIDKLKAIALVFQTRLGLTLFGFDVVIEDGTNTHYVIDINYFPGYEGVSEFPKKFIGFLRQSLLTTS